MKMTKERYDAMVEVFDENIEEIKEYAPKMNNLQAILNDGRIHLTTENGDEHLLAWAHSLYEFKQELEACGVIG